MVLTFKTAFENALRDRPDLTLKEVSARSGVSYEQLKKIKQRDRATTNVDDALRIANAFGLSLDEFMQDDTALIRSEIVALYNRLTSAEIAFLKAAAQGLSAGDQLED